MSWQMQEPKALKWKSITILSQPGHVQVLPHERGTSFDHRRLGTATCNAVTLLPTGWVHCLSHIAWRSAARYILLAQWEVSAIGLSSRFAYSSPKGFSLFQKVINLVRVSDYVFCLGNDTNSKVQDSKQFRTLFVQFIGGLLLMFLSMFKLES